MKKIKKQNEKVCPKCYLPLVDKTCTTSRYIFYDPISNTIRARKAKGIK